MVNYFVVEFYYPPPYDNLPVFASMSTNNLILWEDRAELLLALNKIEFRHEYSWPDGSLYKLIRTKLSRDEIGKKLMSIFNKKLGVQSLRQENARKKHRSGRTFKQLFDSPLLLPRSPK